MLKNYKELKVWQKSYKLCLEVYRTTASFPKDEKFGLTSQVMLSGDLGYMDTKLAKSIIGKTNEVERILKS